MDADDMMLGHSSNDYDSTTGTWDDAWMDRPNPKTANALTAVIRDLVKTPPGVAPLVRRHLDEVCFHIESGWVVQPVHPIHERPVDPIELGQWLQLNRSNIVAVTKKNLVDNLSGLQYTTTLIFFHEPIDGYKAIQIIW